MNKIDLKKGDHLLIGLIPGLVVPVVIMAAILCKLYASVHYREPFI
jgi:hypothetical protein